MPHTPYITPLAQTADWAALLRYWIAHGLQPPAAIEAAQAILASKASQDPEWALVQASIARFAAKPMDPRIERPQPIPPVLSPMEGATMGIAQLFPRMVLCEMAWQYPAEQQTRFFQMGLVVCQA